VYLFARREGFLILIPSSGVGSSALDLSDGNTNTKTKHET
jgi:hypothetical protein